MSWICFFIKDLGRGSPQTLCIHVISLVPYRTGLTSTLKWGEGLLVVVLALSVTELAQSEGGTMGGGGCWCQIDLRLNSVFTTYSLVQDTKPESFCSVQKDDAPHWVGRGIKCRHKCLPYLRDLINTSALSRSNFLNLMNFAGNCLK